MANTGLIGWWLLDGRTTTGNTAPDSSGNNLHGHLGALPSASGLPTWIPDGPPLSRGLRIGALSFGRGADQFVEVAPPDPAILEPCVVSVEAWVRSRNDLSYACYILSKGAQGTAYASYALYTGRGGDDPVSERGGLDFYIAPSPRGGPGGSIASPFVTRREIWDGKWHHVVGTFDGRIVRLYVDGTLRGAGSDPGTPVPEASFIRYNLITNRRFYIGMFREGTSERTGSPFDLGFWGDISDVRIWAGVLSPDEVVLRFNNENLP
jgi:Concanavalin A-like lectin/glucanases superfamily